MLFEPEQVQSAKHPNTFNAQETRTYSNAELTLFWIRVLFTKQSNKTLKLSGKAKSYDFLATSGKYPNNFYPTPKWNRLNLYKVLKVPSSAPSTVKNHSKPSQK